MIERWLERKLNAEGEAKEEAIKKIFHSLHDEPKVHYKRIGYEELKELDLNVKRLEDDQDLQEAVMSIYHLATICAENTTMSKMIVGNGLNFWVRHSHVPR